MKLDLERQRRKVMAGVLMSIALLLSGKSVFNFQSLPVVVPAEPAKIANSSNPQKRKIKMGQDTWLDPTLNYEQLKLTENRIYEGTGRNIFRSEVVVRRRKVAAPPDPAPPISVAETAVVNIRLRFFGFASMPNEPRKAFFGEEDSVFVAREGEIVNRRYRVLKIDLNFVILEDLIEKSLHRLTYPS
jgi:hypothetical protein